MFDRVRSLEPAALVTGGVHHHLVRNKTRTQIGLVVETGEAREVHHMAVLLGYGANAVNPYLCFESITHLLEEGLSPADALARATAEDEGRERRQVGVVSVDATAATSRAVAPSSIVVATAPLTPAHRVSAASTSPFRSRPRTRGPSPSGITAHASPRIGKPTEAGVSNSVTPGDRV